MADVLVVGGGSAGCVLAARLSEDASCEVLLLEGGPDAAVIGELPPDVVDASEPTEAHDWGYVAEPDALGRSISLPRAHGDPRASPRTMASPIPLLPPVTTALRPARPRSMACLSSRCPQA